MNNKYFQLSRYENKGVINIFGDIVEDVLCEDGGVSALSFAYELESIGDVEEIEVYINSYGGSVSAGFAIYNLLKSHPAKIRTINSGFACSIASIIFLAGDERIMSPASLLMVHNPFTCVVGNANELRKTADDLEKMGQVSVDIYCQVTGLDESVIKEMMDNETWITGEEAKEMGFATSFENESDEVVDVVVQSVKRSLINRIIGGETPQQKEEDPVESNVATVDSLQNFINIFRKGDK